MKPLYEKLVDSPDDGFVLKEIYGAACNCAWHFHAEFELVLVQRSRGYRIVGDDVAPLADGDLVFLGPDLPHLYQHDDPDASDRISPHCVLLQFDPRPWQPLWELPAMTSVRRLLLRAAHGLSIEGDARTRIGGLMLDALAATGPRRVIEFLNILDTLARARRATSIASPGFAAAFNPRDDERVNRVYAHIDAHFGRPLGLRELAKVAHLSEGAFSRFFRSRFGQTFPAFLNRLRIGRACRLLAETDWPITEVALSCGYTNLSNFHRQFLRLKKITPTHYRRQTSETRES